MLGADTICVIISHDMQPCQHDIEGDMAKFQALVDGDGYNDEALKNPKYKYKYPAANPASLISEIKKAIRENPGL